jgi:tetratricopeptide (TPR) repeat protein
LSTRRQAGSWLRLPVSRHDLNTEPNQRRTIANAIYDELAKSNIRYALEKYDPSQAVQTIRTPSELLDSPGEGTCLDLAVLFCSLCLANEILPILIVTKGHALAAISLTHGTRHWDRYRPGRDLCASGPLTDVEPLRRLIAEESFLAIECTGFAHSDQLGAQSEGPEGQHRTNGVLSFDQAVEAGRQQLDLADRPFEFALDVAVALFEWKIKSHPLDEPPPGWTRLAGRVGILEEALGQHRTSTEIGDSQNQTLSVELKDKPTLARQGAQLAQQGKYKEAMEVFDQALATNNADLDAWLCKGTVLGHNKEQRGSYSSFGPCAGSQSGQRPFQGDIGCKGDFSGQPRAA